MSDSYKSYKTAEAFRNALELKAKAESLKSGNPLEAVRAARAFEAFLLRIKPSGQALVLKGGFAVYVRFGTLTRPTEDLDLAIRNDISTNSAIRVRAMHRMLEIVASVDLGDFFTFIVGQSMQDLGTGREFDGWRFPVEARIGEREFKRFHIDLTVGDSILSPLDQISIGGTLAFAGFVKGEVDAIRLAQHYCEKLHAYVRVRKRENSRTKDLFDMVFFIRQGLDSSLVAEVITEVFYNCGGPVIPEQLATPPRSWKLPFEDMASNNGMDVSFEEAYKIISDFHTEVFGKLK